MEFTLALEILKQGLMLWNSKESTKYLDRLIKLKKKWHEIYNSQPIDHNALDDIQLELRIIGTSFVEASRVTNPVDR